MGMVRSILGLSAGPIQRATPPGGDDVAVKTALEAYLNVLETIQSHPVRLDAAAADCFSAAVGEVRRAAAAELSPATLDRHTKQLSRTVEAYARQAEDWLQRRAADFNTLLTALAESGQALLDSTDRQTTSLRTITDRIQTIAQTRKLTAIDLELSSCIQELRATVVTVDRENRKCIAHMSGQLTEFQRRLEASERLAATDELTGLLNRRHGTSEIQKRIDRGQGFCVIALDLNGFKKINDTFGHFCGDQVLKTFARRLTAAVRSTDIAIRWGGDEFLVITDCPLNVSTRRASQLAESVGGMYPVHVQAKEISVPVQTSVGVAEYQKGESMESTVGRADEELYRVKRRQWQPKEPEYGKQTPWRIIPPAPKGRSGRVETTGSAPE